MMCPDGEARHAPAQEWNGITLTREQLEEWAGRALTDAEMERLARAIPRSSIPDAIGVIALNMSDGTEEG